MKIASNRAWLMTLTLLLFAGPTLASAPLQKTQGPGYYRQMLGDFEVTVISDGTLPFNVYQLLTNTTP